MNGKNINKLFFISAGFFAVGVILFFAWIIVGMFMSVSENQINHYKDNSNYKEIACEIIEIKYSYMGAFKALETDEFRSYDYSSIGLWESNAAIVTDSGFWTDIKLGDKVYIFATTGYFWDGYTQPIVGLRTENKTYLDFETGKANQIQELESMRKKYLTASLPPIITSAACIFSAVILFIFFLSKKKNPSKVINP